MNGIGAPAGKAVGCALAVLLTVGRAASGGEVALAFLKQVDLPDLGIQLKLPADGTPAPLPSPTVYHYTVKREGQTVKEERSAPADLWRSRQQAGQWIGRHDQTLVLATVRCPLPAFAEKHVGREPFDAAFAVALTNVAPWTEESLARWVADFAGTDPVSGKPVVPAPSRLKPAVGYALGAPPGNTNAYRLAYLFRFNRIAAGQSRAPDAWFCALFTVNRKTPLDEARTEVETGFLPSLFYLGTNRPAAAPLARPLGAPKPGSEPRSAEFLASRQQVLDSLRNMKGWWYVETGNYLVLSNMKGANLLIDALRHDLEVLRGGFVRCIPPRQPSDAVSVIRAFGSSEEYLAYVGKGHEWSGGMWMAERKELVIRPTEWGSSRDKRVQTLEVVYHEAVHQYIFYVLNRVEPAAWFNEGHATFFEAADITGERLQVGEHDTYASRIQEILAAHRFDAEAVLRMSYSQFYGGSPDDRADHYAMAWGLVYYLRKAAPLEKSARLDRVLDAYVDGLLATENAAQATTAAFEGIDLKAFNRYVAGFWESGARRGAAKRNQAFGAAPPALSAAPKP
jgi:hypothetical protein